jgi:RHS repeat-associated protein
MATYPNGRVVTYIYDSADRLLQVKDWAGRTTAYLYEALGNVTSTTYANGAVSTYSYDSANRLLTITNRAGGRVLSSFTYSLDAAGNRAQATDAAGGLTHYGYDALNRLTSWVPPSGQTSTYAYDSMGNRSALTSSAGTTAYVYDDDDRLLSAGAMTFSYDGNGNRLTKGNGGTTTNYSFDAINRLIVVATGASTVQFQYDGDGNRSGLTNAGALTQYTNDIALAYPSTLNENGPNGGVDYQFGLSMLSSIANTFEQFYQRDGAGSMATVTDSTGNLKANYAYDPWGKMLNPVDPLGNKNALKFSGDVLDPTGLYYLRARYYDPTVGSFISRDPFSGSVRDPIARNRYAYARANPQRFSDHSGRNVEPIGAGDISARSGAIGSSLIFSDIPLPGPSGPISYPQPTNPFNFPFPIAITNRLVSEQCNGS